MNAVERVRDYTEEVVDELKKVTWPDFPQLKNATLVVLVFVVIVSAIIWTMDLGVRSIFRGIISLFAN
jgi:preprotein translocase subunit SecE